MYNLKRKQNSGVIPTNPRLREGKGGEGSRGAIIARRWQGGDDGKERGHVVPLHKFVVKTGRLKLYELVLRYYLIIVCNVFNFSAKFLFETVCHIFQHRSTPVQYLMKIILVGSVKWSWFQFLTSEIVTIGTHSKKFSYCVITEYNNFLKFITVKHESCVQW